MRRFEIEAEESWKLEVGEVLTRYSIRADGMYIPAFRGARNRFCGRLYMMRMADRPQCSLWMTISETESTDVNYHCWYTTC